MILNPETIGTALLILCSFVFIYLERRYPYRKNLPLFRDGFWVDLIWYSIFQSFLLKILIFNYIIYPVDIRYNLSSLHIITGWPLWTQILFFLVLHDFYIYCFHRWQHNSKFLWRIHEAHHSDTEIDWLAGARSHSVEILINQTIEFAPIVLLGANPLVVPIKAFIDAIWGMYIHSNINVKSGKLQYVINGPEMHQWHHSNEQQVLNCNYSTKLAFWDWIFGTAYLPDKKPEKYGLPYKFPRDYFVQHAYMVKKIDESKLRNNKWLKFYFNLRPNIIRWIKNVINIA